jgi:phosphatidate cytidylyltransferase
MTQVLNPIGICLLGYLFSPLFAEGILMTLKQKIQAELFHETRLRIHTWRIILTLLVIAVLIGKSGLISLFGLMSFLAFKEYISIIPTRSADRMTILWIYLLIPAQYLFIAKGYFVLSLVFIPVFVFLFLAIRLIISKESTDFLRSFCYLYFGLISLVFSISHGAMFFLQTSREFPMEQKITTVLYVITLTQTNDIAQFIAGKLFGNKKIIPTISPGKTWAGFIGGLVYSSLFGAILGPIMTPLSMALSTLSGFLIAIAGFFGDVTFSAIKRDLKIKDTGCMLPGHGGIIDRIDSLTFAIPLFFHFFNYFWMHL